MQGRGKGLTKYIIKRLLISVLVLFLVSLGAFMMLQLTPGSPVDMYISGDTTPEQVAQMEKLLGLDQPVYIQYLNWLKEILKGNLGYSFSNNQPVVELIKERAMPTVILMGASLIVAYVVGIPLGIYSARKQGTWVDNVITFITFLGNSLPSFFFGLALIAYFGVHLNWLPTGGMHPLGQEPTFSVVSKHLVLPVIVLSAGYMANMARYTRSTIIEIQDQQYIQTAVAKGLNKREIFRGHELRNSLIPIVTVIGNDFPRLVGGSIVVEQVFNWPGLGSLTMNAISHRNYPVVLGVVMLSAVVVLTANLVVDILYAFIDPRIQYD